MKAAVYYNNHDVRIQEVPKPKPGAGELLMRVEASGVCGSDVMEWYRAPKAPLVLGHEVAGVVVETGDGVTAFREGDRIATTHHVPCMECRYCLAGGHPYCDTLRTTHFDPGGFAEFVRLPAVNVLRGTLRVPEHVGFDEASFVEPLACCVRAMRVAGFRSGQTVAVLGAGISGALHVLLARGLGAGLVVATDVHPWRIGNAVRLGADAAIDARDDVPARLREINGGRGADLVMVTTAALPAISQALKCADRGGTVCLFAPAEPGTTFPLPLWDVWRDGITIVHTYAGPPADMKTAMDLIASRRVDVARTITHRLPLDQAQRGFELVVQAGESLKVVLMG